MFHLAKNTKYMHVNIWSLLHFYILLSSVVLFIADLFHFFQDVGKIVLTRNRLYDDICYSYWLYRTNHETVVVTHAGASLEKRATTMRNAR